MPIKRFKNEADLIAKYKLKAGNKYYFHVFLWGSQKSFDENTLDNKPGTSSGCVNLAPTIIETSKNSEREIIRPKLGEIHFIKEKWTTEIVAHELCHALIHRLRMIKPKAEDVIAQEEDFEELVCWEFGRWMDQVYRLLWEDDPPQKL